MDRIYKKFQEKTMLVLLFGFVSCNQNNKHKLKMLPTNSLYNTDYLKLEIKKENKGLTEIEKQRLFTKIEEHIKKQNTVSTKAISDSIKKTLEKENIIVYSEFLIENKFLNNIARKEKQILFTDRWFKGYKKKSNKHKKENYLLAAKTYRSRTTNPFKEQIFMYIIHKINTFVNNNIKKNLKYLKLKIFKNLLKHQHKEYQTKLLRTISRKFVTGYETRRYILNFLVNEAGIKKQKIQNADFFTKNESSFKANDIDNLVVLLERELYEAKKRYGKTKYQYIKRTPNNNIIPNNTKFNNILNFPLGLNSITTETINPIPPLINYNNNIIPINIIPINNQLNSFNIHNHNYMQNNNEVRYLTNNLNHSNIRINNDNQFINTLNNNFILNIPSICNINHNHNKLSNYLINNPPNYNYNINNSNIRINNINQLNTNPSIINPILSNHININNTPNTLNIPSILNSSNINTVNNNTPNTFSIPSISNNNRNDSQKRTYEESQEYIYINQQPKNKKRRIY